MKLQDIKLAQKWQTFDAAEYIEYYYYYY